MEQQALQSPRSQGERHSLTRSASQVDRRGWLQQLGRNIVDRKLETAIQRLVRHEKYASAVMVSFRIVRELEGPLRNLDRHISMLEAVSDRDDGIQSLVVQLRRDRRAIMNVIQRLGMLQDPLETES